MKRITLRVPDHQHAALCRALTLERAERGNRYSLNDLCSRLIMAQLSHAGASLPRAGVAAPLGDGTVHILRTPPPPPVPRGLQSQRDYVIRPAEEPQPERLTKPVEPDEPDPNDQADYDALTQGAIAKAEAEERERFENEGGPDGHLAD